jgi:hypothetical protein
MSTSIMASYLSGDRSKRLSKEVMQTKPADSFVVYGLRETYHELGQYEFKVVLSPKKFKNSHLSDMTLFDSNGKPMSFELQKWGRKMNCRFVIDQSVADGVSVAKLSLRDPSGNTFSANVTWWVIKP